MSNLIWKTQDMEENIIKSWFFELFDFFWKYILASDTDKLDKINIVNGGKYQYKTGIWLNDIKLENKNI